MTIRLFTRLLVTALLFPQLGTAQTATTTNANVIGFQASKQVAPVWVDSDGKVIGRAGDQSVLVVINGEYIGLRLAQYLPNTVTTDSSKRMGADWESREAALFTSGDCTGTPYFANPSASAIGSRRPAVIFKKLMDNLPQLYIGKSPLSTNTFFSSLPPVNSFGAQSCVPMNYTVSTWTYAAPIPLPTATPPFFLQ